MSQPYRNSMIALIVVSLALAACFGGSPEATARKFYRAVEDGELDDATDLVSSAIIGQLGRDKLKAGLAEMTRSIADKGGIDKIEFSDREVQGQVAQLTVTVTYGNGSTESETMKFTREDGKWKLAPEK